MIYLAEYRDKIIEFTYHTRSGKGTMKIRLAEYMENMTVTKIKKLLNLIEQSEHPELVQTFVDYINAWLKLYEPEQKMRANGHVNARDNLKREEADLSALVAARDSFKKNSPQYKQYSELVKSKRDAVSHQKCVASEHLTAFNANKRCKEKYEKVLQFISQG